MGKQFRDIFLSRSKKTNVHDLLVKKEDGEDRYSEYR